MDWGAGDSVTMHVLSGQIDVYLQHRTSTHMVRANDVCVSVFKMEQKGRRRKIYIYCKSLLTPLASLTSSLSFIVVCVIVEI